MNEMTTANQGAGAASDDEAWVWSTLDAYLSKNMLKQTKQRKLIIEYFLRFAETHIDAETVYESLKNDGHNVGLATVYRSLNLLTDANILEKHTFADGRFVYEISHPEDHHDHLVCTDCGHVEEFENEEIERLQHEVAKSLGFSLKDHKLELIGSCIKKNCPHKTS